MKWAYGITTVSKRFDDLLPTTLDSLALGGFENPHIFIDGCSEIDTPTALLSQYSVTCRREQIRTFGNWYLGLLELYIRNPRADRYAMFQDDLVTYQNLRTYIEKVPYPDMGYCNLYTFPENHTLKEDKDDYGWYLSNQKGKGAVALVFNRHAVTTLLQADHMVMRPQDSHRGWRAIDGGIVSAMKKGGYKEFVHNPSLVQHTGLVSVMQNKQHQKADSFRCETFNAEELLVRSSNLV